MTTTLSAFTFKGCLDGRYVAERGSGGGERKRGMQGRREGRKRGVVSFSLQVTRGGRQRRGVMSSLLGAKRGDRETLAVCVLSSILICAHYYIDLYTHKHTRLQTLR